MKTTFIIVTLFAGLAAGLAQSSTTDESFNANSKRKDRHTLIAPTEVKSPYIRGKHVTYSGISVQAVKARNPLQLVNPYAPGAAASAADNAVRDRNNRVRGFKLFAIEF